MRLIDADKLKKRIVIDSDLVVVDDGVMVPCIDFAYIIDEAPTVKAIPIEWLHSIMEKQLIFAMNSEMEGTTTVQDGVIHCISGALACQVLANVIKLWEKENEI